MRIRYMHTIDGKPAAFDSQHGGYLYLLRQVYSGSATPISNVLRDTLKQIRAEQKIDANSRERGGLARNDYGVVKFLD